MSEQTLISLGAASRDSLIEGIKLAADVVAPTLGPLGKNVIIRKDEGKTKIINDGVSIIESVKSGDRAVDCGISLIREASSLTNKNVGDGTTSTAIVTHAIIDNCQILGEQANEVQIKTGIEIAQKAALKVLGQLSTPVKDENLKDIAVISSGGNQEIGELISNAFKKVGKSGGVIIQKGNKKGNRLSVVEGMELEHGIISNIFVMNNKDHMIEMDKALVLLINKRLNTRADALDLVPALEFAQKNQQSLLIIAEDIDNDPLQLLLANRFKSNIDVAAIKASGFGDGRRETFEDLCVALNCNFYEPELKPDQTLGQWITENIKLAQDQEALVAKTNSGLELTPEEKEIILKVAEVPFGLANYVTINEERTIIKFLPGVAEACAMKIAELQAKLDDPEVFLLPADRERIEQRICKLSGIATVYLFADSELELEELKLRTEDALNATRAGIEGGVVPGCGLTFRKISKTLYDFDFGINYDLVKEILSESEFDIFLSTPTIQDGFRAVTFALLAVTSQIFDNCGIDQEDQKLILDEIDLNNKGYNAATGKLVDDMIVAGVIDPTLVIENVIKSACSIAKTVITTNASVITWNDDKKAAGPFFG